MNFTRAAAAAAVLVALAAPAFAKEIENEKGSSKNAEIPVCSKVLGTVAIVDGDGRGWEAYKVGAPSTLLKVFVNRSGCFKVVNRGAGMEAIQREKAMAAGGDLQRGSNEGKGQIKSADWLLVADVAGQNQNSGGSALGGLVGGALGGSRWGALAGGLKTSKVEAQTVLSLVNTRTSEEEYNIEGFAKKQDVSFGLGGVAGSWGGWGGAGGGSYENTDVGKVVGLAFLDAYRQLVTQMGGYNANLTASAPKKAFETTASVALKRSPSTSSSTVRTLPKGAMVYPTGAQEGMWWEVADENDNTGWINNSNLQPKKN